MTIKKYNKKTKKQRGGKKFDFFYKVKEGLGKLTRKQSYTITKPSLVSVTNFNPKSKPNPNPNSNPKPNPNPNPNSNHKPVLVLNQQNKILSIQSNKIPPVNDYNNLHTKFKSVNKNYEPGKLIPQNANKNTVRQYIEHHVSKQLQLYNKVKKENPNYEHPNIDLNIKNGKLTPKKILERMKQTVNSGNGTLQHHKDIIQELINKHSINSNS